MLKTARKIRSFLIFKLGQNNSLKSTLIKGAAGSFGVRIGASGLAFIMSILFARCLGTVGLGTYSYATTWANLLSIPATLGIDQLIVREIAVYRAQSKWGLMKGILSWANLVVLGFSIFLAIIAMAIAWFMRGETQAGVASAVTLALITIPIASLRNLKLGAMKGLHKVVLGQIPDFLFAPSMVVFFTTILYLLYPQNLNVFWVLWIKIIAIIITFIIGTAWLWQSLPAEVKQVKPQYEGKKWLTNALPFMFLGTVQLINSRIDIIMLGNIAGIREVGIYAVIVGIAQLTIFIHQAVNSVLGPTIATLFSEGKLGQLEKIIRKSVLTVFLISLLIGIAMMGLGKYLLLIFGSEFIPGWMAMNILIAGQIFNALTGPVGIVLNMTGNQNYTAIAVGSSAVLNIILNAIFIPQWGINGAATATTISLVIINILNVVFMQKALNISLYSFSSQKHK